MEKRSVGVAVFDARRHFRSFIGDRYVKVACCGSGFPRPDDGLGDSGLATRLSRNAFAESAKYSWESVRDQWLKVYFDLAPRSSKSEQAVVRVV